jgi:hypothetical protein
LVIQKEEKKMKRTKTSRLVALVLCGFGAASVSLAETNVLSIYSAVELEYPTTNGAIYQLQMTDNLLGSWTNQGPAFVGEDGSESGCIPIRGASRKFWRVVEGNVSNVLDFSEARSLFEDNYILFENVQWQGTPWLVYYRVGGMFHEVGREPLTTFQVPSSSITVDGNPADWASIPAVYTDPQHDQQPSDSHPGTDIKEYKIARDATHIYMAYWFYDADPPADGTMYFTEFQQYLNQMHTPGDTVVCASYSAGAAAWQVSVGHREQPGQGAVYGSTYVGVGTKFIEYKIPIADVEYDGGGELQKHGIETRFLRTYVHYVNNGSITDPLTTYDGAGETNKVMIVKFY